MGKMILSLAVAGVLLGAPVLSLGLSGQGGFDVLPEPLLLSPSNDEIDLTDRDSLEFKWLSYVSEIIKRRGYEFKLYKGYDMYADDLIYKELLPRETYSIKIDAAKFENGQVYTWALRQIAMDGIKGEQSFHSFKIKK